MRRHLLFLLIVLALLVVGCNSSVKDARARGLRHSTDRADDRHNLKMDDSRALTPVRLIVKEVLLWSLMVGGAMVFLGGGFSLAYVFVGASFYAIRDMGIQQIALDEKTRQYPVIIYGNGRRIFNLNTGERLLLSETSEAHDPRIEAATRVQLAGLLADGSKIVNSEAKDVFS